MSATTDPELTRRATDLAAQLIETIPDGTPADVAAIAVLTTARYVAAAEPSLAPRIAAVLQHIAHELASGELFANNTH